MSIQLTGICSRFLRTWKKSTCQICQLPTIGTDWTDMMWKASWQDGLSAWHYWGIVITQIENNWNTALPGDCDQGDREVEEKYYEEPKSKLPQSFRFRLAITFQNPSLKRYVVIWAHMPNGPAQRLGPYIFKSSGALLVVSGKVPTYAASDAKGTYW